MHDPVLTVPYLFGVSVWPFVGAYDLRQAEIKTKDEYNRLGGSYDHHGVFHRANGYWDENYEWVPYEGYVNEKGRFVKFAKVEGDLSFMV